MKKPYLTLIILVLLMQTTFCQTTNTLPLNQKKEIIKGLKQGSDLKKTVVDLKEALLKYKEIRKKDSISLLDKDKIISLLEMSALTKESRIKLSEKSNEIEKTIIKEKYSDRFSIGFSVGTTLGNDFVPQPYLGFGINWSLFDF